MTKAFFETIHLDDEMFKGLEKAMADKHSPERKKLDKERERRIKEYKRYFDNVPKPKI